MTAKHYSNRLKKDKHKNRQGKSKPPLSKQYVILMDNHPSIYTYPTVQRDTSAYSSKKCTQFIHLQLGCAITSFSSTLLIPKWKEWKTTHCAHVYHIIYHLFTFRWSIQDYKIHTDMEIVIFLGIKRWNPHTGVQHSCGPVLCLRF